MIYFKKRPLSKCEVRMKKLEELLDQQHFSTFRQAIAPLGGDESIQQSAVGYELLNRPHSSSEFSNAETFYSFAAMHGRSSDVDIRVIEFGLHRYTAEQPHAWKSGAEPLLFVNAHLSTLFSADWERSLHSWPVPHQFIVLELSEREGLASYTKEMVKQKVAQLQQSGIKIAVDDLGMGYSGLYTLAIVRPEYVKIDRQLVSHIQTDPYRQHMMHSLIDYWNREGVTVIAEGIETADEARFFVEAGAALGQGYLFHRPEAV
ncbi:MAG: EAL domain-containing protein [Bacilli bacterium]